MSNDSSSEGSGAKILGVIASVLAILAFLGIATWEDLTNSKLPWSGSDDIADIAVGDCFTGIDPVPTSCDRGTFKVLGRVPYNQSDYEQYWGGQPLTPTESQYEFASCAVALGWDLEVNEPGRATASIYTDYGHEVLCAKLQTTGG